MLNAETVDKINKLQLLIVSHGGVGSNFIADHLEEHGIKLREQKKRSDNIYRTTSNMANKHPNIKIPILYIYGDIVNSMNSQQSRGLLTTNIEKLRMYHNNQNENDPFNYLFQYENFKDCVKLKYPFKTEEIKECFKKLNLNVPIPEIKERSVYHQRPYTKLVQQGVDCYENTVLS